LSNSLARTNGIGAALASDRALPWTPLRDLLGFDPFQNIRASYGFDYEVSRTESGYEVEVPVPGYNSSQIDVTFKDGVLNVAGKSDRRSFTRSFTVPEDIDTNAIGARVQEGMLVLSLKRHPEAQPKKITVGS
jgi:HSP20 family molecular chaperone IbpA